MGSLLSKTSSATSTYSSSSSSVAANKALQQTSSAARRRPSYKCGGDDVCNHPSTHTMTMSASNTRGGGLWPGLGNTDRGEDGNFECCSVLTEDERGDGSSEEVDEPDCFARWVVTNKQQQQHVSWLPGMEYSNTSSLSTSSRGSVAAEKESSTVEDVNDGCIHTRQHSYRRRRVMPINGVEEEEETLDDSAIVKNLKNFVGLEGVSRDPYHEIGCSGDDGCEVHDRSMLHIDYGPDTRKVLGYLPRENEGQDYVCKVSEPISSGYRGTLPKVKRSHSGLNELKSLQYVHEPNESDFRHMFANERKNIYSELCLHESPITSVAVACPPSEARIKEEWEHEEKKARESLYTRATWRMYDRITSARNAQILTHARPSTVGLHTDPLRRNETNNGQLSFKNAVNFSPPSKHVHDYEANMHSPVGSPYHAVFQLSLD